MLLGLDFVANKTESPLDEISKNVPYKLVPIDLPSSPTGDMLTADLEIVTPLSSRSVLWFLCVSSVGPTTAKKDLPRNTDFICGNQKRTANSKIHTNALSRVGLVGTSIFLNI